MQDELKDLVAEALKTYKGAARKALLLLAKEQKEYGFITNPWLDVDILKAIAVTEREGASSTLTDVVAVVDSWERLVLSPDELAGGVSRLVALGLLHRSKERLTTTQRFKKMAPRKEDGRLLLNSAGDRKWRKLVLSPQTKP
jgi:hypothetical protein